jgi:hypothetical protein
MRPPRFPGCGRITSANGTILAAGRNVERVGRVEAIDNASDGNRIVRKG